MDGGEEQGPPQRQTRQSSKRRSGVSVTGTPVLRSIRARILRQVLPGHERNRDPARLAVAPDLHDRSRNGGDDEVDLLGLELVESHLASGFPGLQEDGSGKPGLASDLEGSVLAAVDPRDLRSQADGI